jgi:hypothetical protein
VSNRGQPNELPRSAAIACSLQEADLADRQGRWLELGQRAGIEAVATSNGLRLFFRAVPGVEAELRRLADLERECCAFADWSVRARGKEVVLAVTADSEEAVAAVQAMLGKLRSALATTSG